MTFNCPKCAAKVQSSPVRENVNQASPVASPISLPPEETSDFTDLVGDPKSKPKRARDEDTNSGTGLFMKAAGATGTFFSRTLSVFIGALFANLLTLLIVYLYITFVISKAAKNLEDSMKKDGVSEPLFRPVLPNLSSQSDSKTEKAFAKAPGEAVTIDSVTVKVVSAKLTKPKLISGPSGRESTSTAKNEALLIQLEISTDSDKKKIDYSSLIASFSFGVEMQDNNKNSYRSISFGFSDKVQGQFNGDSITMGKPASDVVCFEVPLDSAEYLDLVISGSKFKVSGEYRFRIPASEWKK